MPALFCRLTMPILLLITSQLGVRSSWPCFSLWTVTSIGPEKSLMTLPSFSCRWTEMELCQRAALHKEQWGGSKWSTKPDCQDWLTGGLGALKSQDLTKIMVAIWAHSTLSWVCWDADFHCDCRLLVFKTIADLGRRGRNGSNYIKPQVHYSHKNSAVFFWVNYSQIIISLSLISRVLQQLVLTMFLTNVLMAFMDFGGL